METATKDKYFEMWQMCEKEKKLYLRVSPYLKFANDLCHPIYLSESLKV